MRKNKKQKTSSAFPHRRFICKKRAAPPFSVINLDKTLVTNFGCGFTAFRSVTLMGTAIKKLLSNAPWRMPRFYRA
ncbi:hypothetical protein [Siminovitchia terrae]|uniref:hypothetical protein n=1 Tax=Siminovitchia terrae TaxID=1914933 RepID=UPI001BB40521|nr:hypothetical protein [Siminovitchia terrae]